MKKNNIIKILFCFFILIIILLILSISIEKDFILESALYFSKDKVIKPTTIDFVRSKIKKILILLFFVNISLILILKFKRSIELIVSKFYAQLQLLNWERIYNLLKKKKFIIFLIGLCLIIFIGTCLFLTFNNDVGADEGYYISSVKSFYTEGKFSFPSRESPSLFLQLIYYPFLLIKPFTSFSIYSLRIVVLIYSLILLLFLMYLINNKYSLECFLIFLILFISDRSIIFVASSGFGEIPAFLPFVIAIFLWTKKQEKKYTFFIALLFALAASTKLQLLFFILILIIGSILFRNKDIKRNVNLLFYTILLWFFVVFFWGIIQGYQIDDIGRTFWRLSSSSSQMLHNIPLSNRLAHINSFFSTFNLVIFSIIIFYYLINYKKVTLFEKTIFIFSCIVTSWWIFSYFAISTRNLTYSIIINYILLSIIITNIIKKEKRINKKMYFSGFVVFFLIINFLNTTVFIYRLTIKGISDEFIFSINGYETFSKKDLKSEQEDFFRFINKNIPQNEKIFSISTGYYESVFTDKKFLTVNQKRKILLPKGSYVIITYIAYKNDHVGDDLMRYLNNNAELVYKKNYYEIYKINKN